MTKGIPLSLQKLKHRFYAVLLPIFLFVASLGWYEESQSDSPDRINMVILPTLILFFIISSWIVFFKKDWIENTEKFNIIAICLVSAIKFTYVVSYELEQTGTLGTFTFWMPIFYMFLFFLLNSRLALLTIAITYIWFLGVGVYKFPELIGTPAATILVQYMFANLVFILTLFFLQTVKQRYIKAEVMEELANTDYLTGLPNRRKIDQALHQALKKQQKISIIYLDIDHFKQINDTFGHTAGDEVLKEFTNETLEVLKEENMLGRWGGEEFMIILKNDLNEAAILAEKIRAHIAQHRFEAVGSLTASFGVTALQEGDTLDTLLNRADKALYKAKNSGRNKVVSNR
ncbi:GGDEF domain-containing protein [Bacillus sp. SG-1]|uniref:GGDEF domain-containing protein n=1 Tax=Bacillus sp. SG-1 TaxID=161544 RepID=UPI0003010AE4|nr:GGDEF domain-containing protein [Bacillus sp. SG-1]